MIVFVPEHYSPIRRMIVGEYLRVRYELREMDGTVVVKVARNLGYKLDKNHSNEFVRKVIKDFIVEWAEVGQASETLV